MTDWWASDLNCPDSDHYVQEGARFCSPLESFVEDGIACWPAILTEPSSANWRYASFHLETAVVVREYPQGDPTKAVPPLVSSHCCHRHFPAHTLTRRLGPHYCLPDPAVALGAAAAAVALDRPGRTPPPRNPPRRSPMIRAFRYRRNRRTCHNGYCCLPHLHPAPSPCGP